MANIAGFPGGTAAYRLKGLPRYDDPAPPDPGGLALEEAVAAAIEDCIRAGHLAEYLKAKRAEVFDMFMTEYDEVAQRAYDRREGYEDGFEAGVEWGLERSREQGREQGIEQLLAQLVEDGALTSEQAAAKRGVLAGSKG